MYSGRDKYTGMLHPCLSTDRNVVTVNYLFKNSFAFVLRRFSRAWYRFRLDRHVAKLLAMTSAVIASAAKQSSKTHYLHPLGTKTECNLRASRMRIV